MTTYQRHADAQRSGEEVSPHLRWNDEPPVALSSMRDALPAAQHDVHIPLGPAYPSLRAQRSNPAKASSGLSRSRRSLAMTVSPGFTLVELSIVLVIIGLILGGVMVGRSMIRSAQLNSVSTDVEAYFAASQMFVDKYACLPGDCTNATTYWTAAANGNGNGQINAASAASTAGETFGAWEQLALSGFIKGVYTGVAGAGSNLDSVLGVNVPAARLTAGGYSWYAYGSYTGNVSIYDGDYGHILHFGKKAATGHTNVTILTPSEAYQIDLKIDDGVPGTGTVRPYAPGAGGEANCSTGTNSTGATSSYNATVSDVACHLIFSSGF
jgi:prepilin-type N-terminal cleavage/methylation domain-containing protein